jgi:hypothetical protein
MPNKATLNADSSSQIERPIPQTARDVKTAVQAKIELHAARFSTPELDDRYDNMPCTD